MSSSDGSGFRRRQGARRVEGATVRNEASVAVLQTFPLQFCGPHRGRPVKGRFSGNASP